MLRTPVHGSVRLQVRPSQDDSPRVAGAVLVGIVAGLALMQMLPMDTTRLGLAVFAAGVVVSLTRWWALRC